MGRGLLLKDAGKNPAVCRDHVRRLKSLLNTCARLKHGLQDITNSSASADQEELSVQFGPIPLFGKRIPLAEIAQVEAGRSGWIGGWGIHYLPGRGWTYNLWGFDCVELNLNGKRLRVGTDDRDNLVKVLADKIATA